MKKWLILGLALTVSLVVASFISVSTATSGRTSQTQQSLSPQTWQTPASAFFQAHHILPSNLRTAVFDACLHPPTNVAVGAKMFAGFYDEFGYINFATDQQFHSVGFADDPLITVQPWWKYQETLNFSGVKNMSQLKVAAECLQTWVCDVDWNCDMTNAHWADPIYAREVHLETQFDGNDTTTTFPAALYAVWRQK